MNEGMKPNISQLTNVFARIGLLSFGGPAGQIAMMHKELVENLKWIDEDDFLHALNFCHLLPGPEAQQLATYIGWKLHGFKGGLIAGLLFIIPGALVILALSIIYSYAAHLELFNSIFLGIKAAVLAIVFEALLRISKRSLNTSFKYYIAFFSFLGLFVFNIKFPIIILFAGLIGIFVSKFKPELLVIKNIEDKQISYSKPKISNSIKTFSIWLLIWVLPFLILFSIGLKDSQFWEIGKFFSKLAIVTFGGAYAVLSYMTQEAVQHYNWLSAGEMADGLGLAETTPGPLILVAQYVGYLAGFRNAMPFSPLLGGLIGASITLWVTFVPCFAWIFTFAPWVEHLQKIKAIKGGLATITAAIVGVIANLTIWFSIHVLFKNISKFEFGFIKIDIPKLQSVDLIVLTIGILSFYLLFKQKLGIMKLLGICALLGGLSSFL
ncbi:MAG: chromate efflux transporter [Caulobacterales bacterium]|nr:chromate efflux transporter [Caulobacterales bacterium]MCA0373315.1 chromate efflux transporter [Pseudomonadota bacterium]